MPSPAKAPRTPNNTSFEAKNLHPAVAMNAIAAFFIFANLILTTNPIFAATNCNSALFANHLPTELSSVIMGLKRKDTLPEYLYRQYSVQQIAEAIVDRIASTEERENTNSYKKEKVNLQNNSELALLFWNDDLASIAQHGFLNQYETKKSTGDYNPKGRIRSENFITGLDLGDYLGDFPGAPPRGHPDEIERSQKLRPKYAFLNITENVQLARKSGFGAIGRYGNIAAILKNEVKKRATWTIEDSLMLAFRRSESTRSDRDLLPYRGTFRRREFPTAEIGSEYYEAQIYGEVGLQDVEYFLVLSKKIVSSMKSYGLPVYFMKEETIKGRLVLKKGELLFHPDPVVFESERRKQKTLYEKIQGFWRQQ